MRIAVDVRELEKNSATGIGSVLINLIKYVSLRKEHEFLFIGNQYTNESLFDKVSFIKETENKRVFWDQVLLPKILRKEKIDLFFSPYYKAPLFCPCPYITMVHDCTPIHYPKSIFSKYYFRFFAKLYGKRAHTVLTVSEYSKNDIVRELKLNDKKIKVVHNGIDDIFFKKYTEEETDKVCKYYKLPKKFILWLGAMRPPKNLKYLVNAYSQLSADIKDEYALVIAGKKSGMYLEVKAMAEKLSLVDNIFFPGMINREHLAILYNASKLFVFPSLYEGFGIPIIEAMASGVPVICSDTSSLPEIADGNAVLVNPVYAKEMTGAMTQILSDSQIRLELIDKGAKRSKYFTQQERIAELYSVLTNPN